jgi:uncharacterized protein HemX
MHEKVEPEENSNETDKLVKKATSMIQLVLLVAALVGSIGKIWWDLDSHKTQLKELKTGFKGLQTKSEENKKKLDDKINDLTTDVAVMKTQVNTVERQTSKVLDKQDKIYDLLLKDKK